MWRRGKPPAIVTPINAQSSTNPDLRGVISLEELQRRINEIENFQRQASPPVIRPRNDVNVTINLPKQSFFSHSAIQSSLVVGSVVGCTVGLIIGIHLNIHLFIILSTLSGGFAGAALFLGIALLSIYLSTLEREEEKEDPNIVKIAKV